MSHISPNKKPTIKTSYKIVYTIVMAKEYKYMQMKCTITKQQQNYHKINLFEQICRNNFTCHFFPLPAFMTKQSSK